MEFDKKEHIFWLDDITELYKDDKYSIIIPNNNMTRIEQLNTISRSLIYLFILILFFGNNKKYMFVPIILLVFIGIINNISNFDNLSKNKELQRILNNRKIENEKEKQKNIDYDLESSDSSNSTITNINEENDQNVKIETGYYDSNGDLYFDEDIKEPEENLYTAVELIEYEKAHHVRPTRDNPFMNPNITQYNNNQSPQASNIDDKEINEEQEEQFNKDLYRNMEDLFNKKNSQRQFYTLPSTSIPNNQIEFAKFAYKLPYSCKEDQERCLRFEDLRTRRIRGNLM
jgi:hypothetical protein